MNDILLCILEGLVTDTELGLDIWFLPSWSSDLCKRHISPWSRLGALLLALSCLVYLISTLAALSLSSVSSL